MGIPRTQKVYTTAVGLRWPWAARGRPRQVPVPNKEPRAVEQVLGGARRRRMVWRRGKKGALAARFVALRIRVGDGPITRPSRNLPGHAVWLAGEWRGNGQRKCHLSSLPADAPLRDPAAAIKARWVCEQAHQQLKQELGLGHSEGRSWTGLRRHALMACIAFAYLQHPRFEAVHSRGKRRKPLTAGGPPPQPSLPAVRRADMARLFARLAGQVRCPHCYRKAADGARP